MNRKKNFLINSISVILMALVWALCLLFFGVACGDVTTMESSPMLSFASDVLLAQFTSAFIIVSVVAVLSDKNNIILWENLVYKNLVSPVGANLISLTLYTFTLVVLSVISYMIGWLEGVFVLAACESIVLGIIIARILSIYFSGNRAKGKVIGRYLKEDGISKEKKLKMLYYKIYEKLSNSDISEMDADVAFLIAESLDYPNVSKMTQSLLLDLYNKNVYFLPKVLTVSRDDFGDFKQADDIYSKYIRGVSQYEKILFDKHKDIYDEIQFDISNSWVSELYPRILISKRNEDETKELQTEGSVFIISSYLEEYLSTYKVFPAIELKLLKYLDSLVEDEITYRNGGTPYTFDKNDVGKLTFRNGTEVNYFVSDDMMPVISQIFGDYTALYAKHISSDIDATVASCLAYLAWIMELDTSRWFIDFKSYKSKNLICSCVPYGSAGLNEKEKLHYDIAAWLLNEIYCPDAVTGDEISDYFEEEEYRQMLDESFKAVEGLTLEDMFGGVDCGDDCCDDCDDDCGNEE